MDGVWDRIENIERNLIKFQKIFKIYFEEFLAVYPVVPHHITQS